MFSFAKIRKNVQKATNKGEKPSANSIELRNKE